MGNLKVLVTAGGTSEKIDDVRKITNTSSGRLGMAVAEEFINRAGAEVTYICGENAVVPKDERVKIVRINDTACLESRLEEFLTHEKYGAVIHAMAVSDYRVCGVAPMDNIAEEICEAMREGVSADGVRRAITKCVGVGMRDKKISSNIENPIIVMEKTPKIIGMIKNLHPETILVGFKLLAGANDDELLEVGHNLLLKNDCDFVLANDSERISGERHEGILIKPDKSYTRHFTKRQISASIAENVLLKLR